MPLYANIAASKADSSLVQLGNAMTGDKAPKKSDVFYTHHLERLGFEAIAAEDYATARTHFTQIIDNAETPQTIKQRAEKTLSWISAQTSSDTK